jgi:hypothetical protein
MARTVMFMRRASPGSALLNSQPFVADPKSTPTGRMAPNRSLGPPPVGSRATRTKLALKWQAPEVGLWEINPVKRRPQKI